VQLKLRSGLDRFSRGLTCRGTVLAQVVIEALELARFDRSLVAALEPDIEGVNRDLAEAVLTYTLWRLAWCRRQRHARQTAAA
jgi:hypothetical protein